MEYSYWQDQHNGICHRAPANSGWPSARWQPITKAQYDQWVEDRRGYKYWTQEQKQEQKQWDYSQKE